MKRSFHNVLFQSFSCLLYLLWGTTINAQNSHSIHERTAFMKVCEGFFDFYWDEENGEIFLEVDKFNQEFLYVNALVTGLGSNKIGLDRGQLGQSRVVYFEKIGAKIYLIEKNLKYRTSSINKFEQQAVGESFPTSILWAWFPDTQENGRYLINLSEFLLRDAHGIEHQLFISEKVKYRKDELRSAFYPKKIKNFPKNTEFETLVTFIHQNGHSHEIEQISPSFEAFTVRQHHSFVELPDSNYNLRAYATRSGFFPFSFYDFNTSIDKPLKTRWITRHRLEKKNPSAKQSKPIKPIIYYVDRGIPEPIRSAVIEGASWWNEAFEAIGYKDAFQVKLLPENADIEDVRYSVIQWVHRKERGWSYGSSLKDPRTGEIIKGHVSLGSLRIRYDYLLGQGLNPYQENIKMKETHNQLFEMALSRIRQLAAHEVGHSLGLMHNFASSADGGHSVMDYPHPKLKLTAENKIDLSEAYLDKLGEWDKVAIAYGYSDFDSEKSESQKLDKLLKSALQQNLGFISDQDARGQGSLHPSAHLWDNGQNPVKELKNILNIRRVALAQFSEKNIAVGTPHALLEEVLVPVYNLHRYQIEATAKLIGGMSYSYSFRGDNQIITKIVSAEKQQKAFEALLECLSPDILTLPENIIRLIPPRPISYEKNDELFSRKTGLSFDPISTASVSANHVLGLLLHPERTSRLIEFQARFGSLGLDNVIGELIEKTWHSERKTGLLLEIQRNTEQLVLHHLIDLAHNPNTLGQVRAITLFYLKTLRQDLETELQITSSIRRKAHLHYAIYQLDNPNLEHHLTDEKLPRGAPLGCGID